MSSSVNSNPPNSLRYTSVAILLHWTIAAAIVGNLALGWWMQIAIDIESERARAVAGFQLHKSIGLTILGLGILRFLWRLIHRPPAPLEGSSRHLLRVAHAMHWLFYLLMLALPLSGWLYISAQWRGNGPMNVPTLWFNWVEVSHLLSLNKLAGDQRSAIATSMADLHSVLAWTMTGMLLLHVLGAFKHQFIQSGNVLLRMLPQLPRRARLTSIASFILAVLIVALMFFALIRIPITASKANLSTETVIPVPEIVTTSITTNQEKSTSTDSRTTNIQEPATSWLVDQARSKISFSGTHAGVPFEGTFTRWKTDIKLFPKDPSLSHFQATFEAASATDGVPLHDESLPQTEWFDATNHPNISFTSTHVMEQRDGKFNVDGYLTIKGHRVQVPALAFTSANGHLKLTGEFKVSRKAADLGMESDPDATWISPEITVRINVEGFQKNFK